MEAQAEEVKPDGHTESSSFIAILGISFFLAEQIRQTYEVVEPRRHEFSFCLQLVWNMPSSITFASIFPQNLTYVKGFLRLPRTVYPASTATKFRCSIGIDALVLAQQCRLALLVGIPTTR